MLEVEYTWFFDAILENYSTDNFVFRDFMPYGEVYQNLTINRMILYSLLSANQVLGNIDNDAALSRVTDIHIDDLSLCKEALANHGLIDGNGLMVDIFVKHYKG